MNCGAKFCGVVVGVEVASAGKTSIWTSWVVVAFPSEAKNFAVVVPRVEVATGVQEKIPVEVAQEALSGSTDEKESSSLSGSVAVALNTRSVPRVVEAWVGPLKTGG